MLYRISFIHQLKCTHVWRKKERKKERKSWTWTHMHLCSSMLKVPWPEQSGRHCMASLSTWINSISFNRKRPSAIRYAMRYRCSISSYDPCHSNAQLHVTSVWFNELNLISPHISLIADAVTTRKLNASGQSNSNLIQPNELKTNQLYTKGDGR